MKICVIVPVYNAEKYIKQTVNSILNQPYKGVEVVLVDDGSKDNSPVICDEIAKESVRVHTIHQANAGVSVARNTGINYVINNINDADYIALCDADDFYVPNTIDENTIRNIKENNYCDIVIFGSYESNTDAKRFRIEYKTDSSVNKLNAGTLKWIIVGTFAANFYKVSLFKEYGLNFSVGIKYNEDIIFGRSAVFCASSYQTFDKMLYVYRLNPKSVTRSAKVSDLHGNFPLVKCWIEASKIFDNCSLLDDTLKQKWSEDCLKVAGARTLESLRALAENNTSAKEINELLSETNYLQYIDLLSTEYLAQWQKNDLVLYRKGLEDFINYHKKSKLSYMVKRLSEVLAYNGFLRVFYDKKKYSLTSL